MTATVNINSAFERNLVAAIDKGLGEAVSELRDEVKEEISTLFPPDALGVRIWSRAACTSRWAWIRQE
jgi:hypothetical protein